MKTIGEPPSLETIKNSWQKMVAPYQRSDLRRSLGQLANSLLPYLGLWVLMVLSLRVSYWLTLVLIVPAAGFLVRLFIIFHDCGHGSFFNTTTANRRVGFFLGLLVFTPSESWWHAHAVHHATAGNLDKRGVGDVMTMTVEEYQKSSRWQRISYRFFRHPAVLLGLGPFFSFLVMPRFPTSSSSKSDRRSILLTDLALAVVFVLMSLLIGVKEYLIIQVPVMWLAGAAGIWMFYVQHQFETVYWARSSEWDYTRAALEGASFYRLPRVLQWFTGNIGFHHIHHLSPRIPNYFLEKCFKENPLLTPPLIISLRTALKSLSLRLWDERTRRMVGFRALRTRPDSSA